jgi:hypothetical protein
MSTPFAALRKLAADRRDKAFEAARREFDSALQDIAALEKKLVLRAPVKRPRNRQTRKLIDTIVSVIPDDRTFNRDDLCGWVREADPERTFTKATITTNINRLIGEGVLKRVTTAAGKQRATYAVPSFECPEPAPSMLDMAEEVLREKGKPMDATSLMVALLDRGVEPEFGPKQALDKLVHGMRKRGERFRQDESGGWKALAR